MFTLCNFSGKDRNLNIVELLCATCSRWFHESCIGFQLGKLIPFATNYIFICKNCSPTGLESFRKSQASKSSAKWIAFCTLIINSFSLCFPQAISQMCVTAMANMQQAALKEGKSKILFNKDQEIIPYIEQYWEAMTTMPRRVTQSWWVSKHWSDSAQLNNDFSYSMAFAGTKPFSEL